MHTNANNLGKSLSDDRLANSIVEIHAIWVLGKEAIAEYQSAVEFWKSFID